MYSFWNWQMAQIEKIDYLTRREKHFYLPWNAIERAMYLFMGECWWWILKRRWTEVVWILIKCRWHTWSNWQWMSLLQVWNEFTRKVKKSIDYLCGKGRLRWKMIGGLLIKITTEWCRFLMRKKMRRWHWWMSKSGWTCRWLHWCWSNIHSWRCCWGCLRCIV